MYILGEAKDMGIVQINLCIQKNIHAFSVKVILNTGRINCLPGTKASVL